MDIYLSTYQKDYVWPKKTDTRGDIQPCPRCGCASNVCPAAAEDDPNCRYLRRMQQKYPYLFEVLAQLPPDDRIAVLYRDRLRTAQDDYGRAPPPPPAPAPPPAPPPTPALRPKPILIDKQASEPNTPIAKSFTDVTAVVRTMQRGHSDLSHRIRKRVTLSSIPSQYMSSALTVEPYTHEGEVVIVVPPLNPNEEDHEIDFGSPKTTESTTHVIYTPESIKEDLQYSWDGGDDSVVTENTALLRRAAATEIIITPISPTASSADLSRLDAQEEKCTGESSTIADIHKMDLLKPEVITLSDES